MQPTSLVTPNFHLDDLAIKGYRPIDGNWDTVNIVGEIPQYKVLLTFHGHHMSVNLTSRLTEWSTLNFSINKEFEIQGECRSVSIIYSDPPVLMVAKRKEVQLYRYIPSEKLQLYRRILFQEFVDQAAYIEVQKLPLEPFGLFGVAAFARGLDKDVHRVYEVKLFELNHNKYVRKIRVEQGASMVAPLVLEKKQLVIIGTGKFLNVFQANNWRLTKRVAVPTENEVIFDIKHLKTRDIIIAYTKNEENMAGEPKLVFWKVNGLKFLNGPVKWITHNISRNFFVFDGFDFFFSFASQTRVLFQNVRGTKKELDLELPIKGSGCSFYKINEKNRILSIFRNQSKFYLVLITY